MKLRSVRFRVRLAIVGIVGCIVAAGLSLTSESSLGDQVADALHHVSSLFTLPTVAAPASPSGGMPETGMSAIKSGEFGVTLGDAIVAHHNVALEGLPHLRNEWFAMSSEGKSDAGSWLAVSHTGDPGTVNSGHDAGGGVGTGDSGGSGGGGGGGAAASAPGGGTPGGGGVSGSRGSNGEPPAQKSTSDDPFSSPPMLSAAGDPPLAAVPEPGTLLLLGSAASVLGAWGVYRRSSRRS
jgi:PEP-CTERM motif